MNQGPPYLALPKALTPPTAAGREEPPCPPYPATTRPPQGAPHSATPAALAKLTALAAREKAEVDLSLDADGLTS
ncbi:MAG: hypothetical protein ACPGUV_08570 [Polyangiales bacterium]